MSAAYYEYPDLLYQGLMSASSAILFTSPALAAGGNPLRPPSILFGEVLISNVSATVDYYLTLHLVVGSGSISDANIICPSAKVNKRSFTRLTFATVMPAGYTLRGSADVANKLSLTITGVKRIPLSP